MAGHKTSLRCSEIASFCPIITQELVGHYSASILGGCERCSTDVSPNLELSAPVRQSVAFSPTLVVHNQYISLVMDKRESDVAIGGTFLQAVRHIKVNTAC